AFCGPLINISENYMDASSVLQNKFLKFLSVRSNVSRKPTCNKIDELYDLIRKQNISDILLTKKVYAIGPYIQENKTMPYIACWSAEPLDNSTLEEISNLFHNEYDITYHLIDARYIDMIMIQKVIVKKEFIEVASNGKVETKDKKYSQDFNIANNIWTRINFDLHKNQNYLEVILDLKNIGVSEFLSESCQNSNSHVYYYIDSVNIKIILISSDSNRICISIKERHSPQIPDKVTYSKSAENGVMFKGGYPANIGVEIGIKRGKSVSSSLDEWYFESTKGNKVFNGNTNLKMAGYSKMNSIEKKFLAQDPFFNCWYIFKEIKELKILITQTLGYAKRSNFLNV
ncbi:26030_t:CDS:2, partial [Gigaspora margarita]